MALLTSRHLSFDIKPIRVHVRKAPISDLFSSLCARVFSRPAAILKAEKTLGTRLDNGERETSNGSLGTSAQGNPPGNSATSFPGLFSLGTRLGIQDGGQKKEKGTRGSVTVVKVSFYPLCAQMTRTFLLKSDWYWDKQSMKWRLGR